MGSAVGWVVAQSICLVPVIGWVKEVGKERVEDTNGL